MRSFPIGVILESLRQPIPQALDTIQALGVQECRFTLLTAICPPKLTKASKKEFKKMVDDRGLMISALVGNLGRRFGDPEKNPG